MAKDALIAEVWPDLSVTDDSLTQCIADIRRAFGPGGKDIVETFPKRGYRLNLPCPAPCRHRKLPLRTMAAVASGTALLGGWALLAYPSGTMDPAARPSVAVAPFVDLAADDRWTRIAAGLSDELSASLARSGWLTVRHGSPDDPAMAGYTLSGTLHAADGGLRVSARLVDAATGEILWSDLRRGKAEDLFVIQTQILERTDALIAAGWTGAVARDGIEAARDLPTDDLDAWHLYLRAIERKHSFTPEALAAAENDLLAALDLDPDFGRAWTALAIVRLLRMEHAESLAVFEHHLDGRIAATEMAMRLAPEDPETLIQSSFLLGRAEDHTGAEAALRRAVHIAPNDPDILAQAAWAGARRAPLGKDAVGWARRALALNPAPPPWYQAGLATALFYAGDYPAAWRAYEQAPPVTEVLYRQAATAAYLGHADRAAALLSQVRSRLPEGLTIEILERTDGATWPAHVARLAGGLGRIPGRETAAVTLQ